MLHNLAHIELNAIDLAMDTVARFAHLRLPAAFYEDFARVADDESRHFCWTLQRLQELGAAYGDMAAHDLLWEGAQLSSGDLNARLAIVPMSQEARGLDAGQRLVERLVGAGDRRSAAVVAQIALEEKAHVAIGVAWFKRVCEAQGVAAPGAFRSLLASLSPELLKGPFNHAARSEVGLSKDWYDVQCWPEDARAGMVAPAQAAAAKGRGQRAARRPGGGEGAGGAAAAAGAEAAAGAAAAAAGPGTDAAAAEDDGGAAGGRGGWEQPGGPAGLGDLSGQGLDQLRQRLAVMLDTETAAAAL